MWARLDLRPRTTRASFPFWPELTAFAGAAPSLRVYSCRQVARTIPRPADSAPKACISAPERSAPRCPSFSSASLSTLGQSATWAAPAGQIGLVFDIAPCWARRRSSRIRSWRPRSITSWAPRSCFCVRIGFARFRGSRVNTAFGRRHSGQRVHGKTCGEQSESGRAT